jgi:CheY-like chemotaxis protein
MEMPVMDGLEATSKILYYEGVNQFNHVPIIALTADANSVDTEKYQKAGIDDYLTKPIDENDIYTLVQKYCIDIPKEMAQTEEDELFAKVLAGDFLKE